MTKLIIRRCALVLAMACILFAAANSQAAKMISVPATVETIDLQTKSMKLIYKDPDTNEIGTHEVYWDRKTEIIQEGPPPDMKETPAKSDTITKGAKLHVRIEVSVKKGGRTRLDGVRIKP